MNRRHQFCQSTSIDALFQMLALPCGMHVVSGDEDEDEDDDEDEDEDALFQMLPLPCGMHGQEAHFS